MKLTTGAQTTAMSPMSQLDAGDAVPGLSTNEVIGGIFIILFFISVIFLIYLLCKYPFLGANLPLTSMPRRAIDPNLLKSLPVTVISSADFNGGIECAICLSELTDGEEARKLPCCRHHFHLECIDMLFGFNSIYPIFRSSIDSKNVIFGALEQSPVINERALQQEMVVSVDESREECSSTVSSGSRKPS